MLLVPLDDAWVDHVIDLSSIWNFPKFHKIPPQKISEERERETIWILPSLLAYRTGRRRFFHFLLIPLVFWQTKSFLGTCPMDERFLLKCFARDLHLKEFCTEEFWMAEQFQLETFKWGLFIETFRLRHKKHGIDEWSIDYFETSTL